MYSLVEFAGGDLGKPCVHVYKPNGLGAVEQASADELLAAFRRNPDLRVTLALACEWDMGGWAYTTNEPREFRFADLLPSAVLGRWLKLTLIAEERPSFFEKQMLMLPAPGDEAPRDFNPVEPTQQCGHDGSCCVQPGA